MIDSYFKPGTLGLALSALVSCAQMPSGLMAERHPQVRHGAAATTIAECREVLGNPSSSAELLDAESIRLISWNTRKGQGRDWWQSVQPWLEDADLLLLQEAIPQEASPTHRHLSFAPGFATRKQATGVLTLSAAEPLAACRLTVHEPWLGTPKAISVTEFGLSGTPETLLVVNVHAVNFAFGLAAFERQLHVIFEAIGDHAGPLVVSGDFNTWRPARGQLLQDWTVCHGLTAVNYSEDHRVTVFGQHLDQVFVRGLDVAAATTRITPSSDHNPMLVTLTL